MSKDKFFFFDFAVTLSFAHQVNNRNKAEIQQQHELLSAATVISPFDLGLVLPGKDGHSPSQANFRERFYVKRVGPFFPSQQLIYR